MNYAIKQHMLAQAGIMYINNTVLPIFLLSVSGPSQNGNGNWQKKMETGNLSPKVATISNALSLTILFTEFHFNCFFFSN